jgi:CubicO group peptidase (beta-lactamase class C family)
LAKASPNKGQNQIWERDMDGSGNVAARGFSADALGAIPAALQGFVDQGALAGLVTLTWRDGEIAQVLTVGNARNEDQTPMARDTIFRIMSMSKPVTSVAILMQIEEGKLGLHEPVTKWLPEFANMMVLDDPAGPLDKVHPANRDITVEDLLTHRSGLAYGFSSRGPLGKAHSALGDPLHTTLTPDEWLAELGKIPLTYQPGDLLHYSHSTDVLGFLAARVDGKTFPEVLQDRIFGPLGMVDTSFWVEPAKRNRVANTYAWSETEEKLALYPMPEFDAPLPYVSGGGGLFSTVDDYLKFARMLIGGGEVDGVRLLKAETVADMATNRLSDIQRANPFLGLPMWAASGFGLGVIEEPEKNMLGMGSKGSFGWPGAFGTWWQADPEKNLIMIFMIQHQIPLGPDAGAMIAAGRGMAGRMALPVFQRMTYGALAG